MPLTLTPFAYTPEALDRLVRAPQDHSAFLREIQKAPTV